MHDSTGRFLTRSAVFIALVDKKGKVLLTRRANTGYMDGYYDLPSGHVEFGETLLQAAVRELQEETGARVKEADLGLWHINQFAANKQYYYNFFFAARVWNGTPTITEPEKCDDVDFFLLENLPELTPGSKVALADMPESGEVTFGYIDQKTYDAIAG